MSPSPLSIAILVLCTTIGSNAIPASITSIVGAHAAIDSFIRSSLENFRIEQPLASGFVAYDSNERILVQLNGGLNLQLASLFPISVVSTSVNLHSLGDQISVNVIGFAPVITGTYSLRGNIGHTENLGGAGNFTIIPNPAETNLNAGCRFKVDTNAEGFLQFVPCTSGTFNSTFSFGPDTAVQFSPPLVNTSSLVDDINSIVLSRGEMGLIGGSTFRRELASGLMRAITTHLQADFNGTKLLDIISNADAGADSGGRFKPKEKESNGEFLERENVYDVLTREPGLIASKLSQFGADAIRELAESPAFNPYLPELNSDNITLDKALVKLNGQVSNVAFSGFSHDLFVNVTPCYECGSNFDLEIRINSTGGILSGDFQLDGNLTTEIPIGAVGSFRLTGIRTSLRVILLFSIREGRFSHWRTDVYESKFSQTSDGDAESHFTPSPIDGIDLEEKIKAYVDHTIARAIMDQLSNPWGYASAMLKETISQEVIRRFEETPALDMLLG